ncbi:type III secretion system export apparatus subunit SctS [Paraburkholderia phosphatilytica]|uniref:type III secretion system export apparatus subunit SctS n=1 Tax=Paraburkholderia phosphatilytica TaxID=2282883 RepID=UPI000E51FD85|nr:type III secretion system export apparatus subunit SctS [Paraburkholderia phosphatilytica]
MDADAITHLTTNALTLCLLVSLPAVGVAAAAGLLISFIQAVTSLQDTSISHGLKFLIVTVVIIVAAPWGASAVMQFAQSALRTVFP